MSRNKFGVPECSVNAPGQNLRCKWRFGLNFNDLSDLSPDPLRKVRKIDVRTDALMLRQRPLQMTGDRRAGDDDFLCRERAGGLPRQMFKQCFPQRLKAV